MATPLAKAIVTTVAYAAAAVLRAKRGNNMSYQQHKQCNEAMRNAGNMTAQAWKDYKNSK